MVPQRSLPFSSRTIGDQFTADAMRPMKVSQRYVFQAFMGSSHSVDEDDVSDERNDDPAENRAERYPRKKIHGASRCRGRTKHGAHGSSPANVSSAARLRGLRAEEKRREPAQ